jgi:hypothetical protein
MFFHIQFKHTPDFGFSYWYTSFRAKKRPLCFSSRATLALFLLSGCSILYFHLLASLTSDLILTTSGLMFIFSDHVMFTYFSTVSLMFLLLTSLAFLNWCSCSTQSSMKSHTPLKALLCRICTYSAA